MDGDSVVKSVLPQQFDRRPAQFPWNDVLQYMINPVTTEEFFSRYYEREYLYVSRNDPEPYAPLLSIDKIDRFIAGSDLREGMVDLVDQGREIHREDYVADGGLIIRRDVIREHQMGATLVFPQLHHSDPILASFCQAIEHKFSCHSQTNIYMTPPDRQGFPIHYDNHDVFVLQISGEKRWRLYNVSQDTPYRGEGFERARHKVGDKQADFVMRPGDMLYVPRGLMHDALTVGDEPSLHITVGLIVKTWADLMLEAVSQLMVEDTDFRRSLPIGHASDNFDRTEARAFFKSLTAKIAEKAKMDDALDLLADQFIRSRDQDVSLGILEATKPISQKQVYQRRPFIPYRIAEEGENVILISPGGDTEFPAKDLEALERALSGEPFTVRDLSSGNAKEMIRSLTAAGAIGSITDSAGRPST